MSRSFRSLLFRAAQLQALIESEQRRPRSDGLTLLRLKALRLRIGRRLRALPGKVTAVPRTVAFPAMPAPVLSD
jgi:hypothetical protein